MLLNFLASIFNIRQSVNIRQSKLISSPFLLLSNDPVPILLETSIVQHEEVRKRRLKT